MNLSVPTDRPVTRQPSDEPHFSLLVRSSVQRPDDERVEPRQRVKARASWNVWWRVESLLHEPNKTIREDTEGDVKCWNHWFRTRLRLEWFLSYPEFIFVTYLRCEDTVLARTSSWLRKDLTEAILTRSTIPSTNVSTSMSTFLFHSSSIASRYSAEFWSTDDWEAVVRWDRLAVGRADGRDTSVWGISDILLLSFKLLSNLVWPHVLKLSHALRVPNSEIIESPLKLQASWRILFKYFTMYPYSY